MNANELADYITENSYIGTITMEDVATMLRQQQAEIEALKAEKLEYAEEVLEALNWGNYAGDYFQQKHGWYDDVAKWNGIVDLLRKAQEKWLPN